MSADRLRVAVVDDERPAQQFLVDLLKARTGVEIVGTAASGDGAIVLIEATRPDLVLLDLKMPGLGGLEVIRHLPPATAPTVAIVTAFEESAVEAFALDAVDYLLKPVDPDRLDQTLARARARLLRPGVTASGRPASDATGMGRSRRYVERIPVRHRSEIFLVPVRHLTAIVADGELLHLTTLAGDKFTLNYRLHRLERQLDPRRFIRLARGTLVNLETVVKVGAMPGGTYTVTLSTGQQLAVSRIHSRILRDTLLRL
ncbi:MAG TPA: response regulator [Vicinamibacterales bacterium]|jgi:two-component system LytT family response regulator|nr:response regulator [Vicinamibacterales bacterium]